MWLTLTLLRMVGQCGLFPENGSSSIRFYHIQVEVVGSGVDSKSRWYLPLDIIPTMQYHNIDLIQEQVASVMTSLWSLVKQAEGIVLRSGLPPNSAQQTQTNVKAEHGLEQP